MSTISFSAPYAPNTGLGQCDSDMMTENEKRTFGWGKESCLRSDSEYVRCQIQVCSTLEYNIPGGNDTLMPPILNTLHFCSTTLSNGGFSTVWSTFPSCILHCIAMGEPLGRHGLGQSYNTGIIVQSKNITRRRSRVK